MALEILQRDLGLREGDRYTVVVRFKDAFVPFLSYAASDWNPVLPKEVYDQDGHFKETVAGTGAYTLDKNGSQKGARWLWKKNPAYWDSGKPYLDEIRWFVLPNETTSFSAFQTKQLDILTQSGLDYEPAQVVKKANPDVPFYKWMEPRATQLYLSQKPERNSPVRDERVRRAMSLAINRDELNKIISGGASATYGADAMAGVTNFILKKNFQGIELDGRMAVFGYLASIAAIAWLTVVVFGIGKIASAVFA